MLICKKPTKIVACPQVRSTMKNAMAAYEKCKEHANMINEKRQGWILKREAFGSIMYMWKTMHTQAHLRFAVSGKKLDEKKRFE